MRYRVRMTAPDFNTDTCLYTDDSTAAYIAASAIQERLIPRVVGQVEVEIITPERDGSRNFGSGTVLWASYPVANVHDGHLYTDWTAYRAARKRRGLEV